MRQYWGFVDIFSEGSLMKRRMTTLSNLMSMFRSICLTSCLKKSRGLFSLISPGSSICQIITFSCCSFMASLKFSANFLLGLRSSTSYSAESQMLLLASSLQFGNFIFSFPRVPAWSMYGLLRRDSRLILSLLKEMLVRRRSLPSPTSLKSSICIWSDRNSFRVRSRIYFIRFFTGLKSARRFITLLRRLRKIIKLIIIKKHLQTILLQHSINASLTQITIFSKYLL